MSNNSRTKNLKLNVLYGYIAQIGTLLFSFAGRRIFLRFLSADYLGINGLYSNILTILSLAELGLDTAVVYSLYQPVADDNKVLIASMLNYFRKLYLFLAGCIFAIGLLLIPFLDMLVSSNLTKSELILYYILFLTNTVASYFVAYKVALLSAYQEQRIHKIVILSSNLILQILHIIVLMIWKKYLAYVVATVISTIIANILLNLICNKRHSDILKIKEQEVFDKTPIIQRVISVFLYKFGTVLINSTDNILISVLASTIAVGYYSNYYTVVAAMTGFISIITSSLISGVGNYAVHGKKEEQGMLFDMFLLPYHIIAALGLVGFSQLFNNLITIWLGTQYLFDNKTVFIIAFNFYLSNAISPVWMFREANGLFDKVKFLILIRAVVNIVLSIVFGILWGVFGIFLATAVSLIITSFWYEPCVLSNEVFHRSQSVYWKKQIKYFLEACIAWVVTFGVIKNIGDSFLMFMIKVFAVIVITIGVFVICNYKTDDFMRLSNYLRRKNNE